MRYLRLIAEVTRLEFRQFAAYRSDLILRLLSMPIQVAMMIGLWWAILQHDSASRNGVFEYLIVVTFLSRLLNLARVASFMGYKIHAGALTENLVRPLPVWCEAVGKAVAQAATGLMVVAPVALLATLRAGSTWSSLAMLTYYLTLGLVLQFLLYYLVGLLSFWLEEVRGLLFGFGLVLSLLGGSVIPLEYMPSFLLQALSWTPLPYLFYVPTKQILGGADLALFQPGVPLLWVGLLVLVAMAVYRAGCRRYAVSGI